MSGIDRRPGLAAPAGLLPSFMEQDESDRTT